MKPAEQAVSAILTYHSIDGIPAVTSINPELFRVQMEWLAASGIETTDLAGARQSHGRTSITFDDGYRNFLDHALPVLVQHGLPATLFVITSKCGVEADYLDWSALREIASAGVELGAHSVSHRDLTKLTEGEAVAEMEDSAKSIEDRIGVPVRFCAYPYGRSTRKLRDWAREAFTLSCGTRLAYLGGDDDPADLPRLDVFYLRRLALFRRLMSPAGRLYLAGRAALRQLREHWSGDE
jgi:peptidoglycan/xylan/chitin deacetylase (PgdA/CDA1 family)